MVAPIAVGGEGEEEGRESPRTLGEEIVSSHARRGDYDAPHFLLRASGVAPEARTQGK